MKLWHIPPRFLDDDTLLSEQQTALDLFNDIADHNPHSSIPEGNRLFMMYCNHHEYVLYRLMLINKEVERRGLDEPMGDNYYHEFLERVVTTRPYEIEYECIQRDIDILQSVWEEFTNTELGEYVGNLSLSETEQIKSELDFQLSSIEAELED